MRGAVCRRGGVRHVLGVPGRVQGLRRSRAGPVRRKPRSLRCRLRKERIDLLRDALIEALGNMCSGEGCQTPADNLEINHVDGCTWDQRRAGRENRFLRYLREYRAGVRLNILCRSCNAAQNQHTHGTRDERELEEAPF